MENHIYGIEVVTNACGIKKIVDCKINEHGQQLYKVKWEPTWEPADNLAACQHLVDKFWSHINLVKVNEQKTEHHNKRIKLESGTNGNMNYGQLSADSKASVQQLIARTNSTSTDSSSLIPPSMSLNSNKINGPLMQNVKLENNKIGKSNITSLLKNDTSKSKGASNLASLKYLENFDNPYVKCIVVCKVCNKEQSFKHAHHWKRHYYTHTDEKPHKCQHCPRSFVEADKLRHHVNSKHKDVNQSQMMIALAQQMGGPPQQNMFMKEEFFS